MSFRTQSSYLATTKDLVIRQVEDVHDELGHRVATDPEEHSLAILDKEQTMTLQSF